MTQTKHFNILTAISQDGLANCLHKALLRKQLRIASVVFSAVHTYFVTYNQQCSVTVKIRTIDRKFFGIRIVFIN